MKHFNVWVKVGIGEKFEICAETEEEAIDAAHILMESLVNFSDDGLYYEILDTNPEPVDAPAEGEGNYHAASNVMDLVGEEGYGSVYKRFIKEIEE